MIFSKNFRAKGAKWYQQQCFSSFMKKISKIFQKVTGSCMFKSELKSFFEKNSVLRFLGWRGPKCFSVFMNKKFLKFFWFFAWRSSFFFFEGTETIWIICELKIFIYQNNQFNYKIWLWNKIFRKLCLPISLLL